MHILQYKHNHILAGHFSQNKTLELVQQDHIWPDICTTIKKFCKSCVTCMRSKPQHHKPYGNLKQPPIPDWPWDSISMDFIEKLPKSSGYETILVIVNCLIKQSLFISIHDTITSAELTHLFIIYVFLKHGVSGHVTSNCGSEFISHFF